MCDGPTSRWAENSYWRGMTAYISWVQSMIVGEFDNDVARITENALRAAPARAQA
jgi:hypothetical protein